MTDPKPPLPIAAESLEREKWQVERGFREREVTLAERQHDEREAELTLAASERTASRWRSPLVVAILAAGVAALGNAFVAYTNGAAQTHLAAQEAEQTRILEVLKTGNPDTVAENLGFLLNAGLITDRAIRRNLTTFLAKRSAGSGPVLPSSSGAVAFTSGSERTPTATGRVMAYKDEAGETVIGDSHVLTAQELRSGRISIGGHAVDFRIGITSKQAGVLLNSDLAPFRARIRALVTVPLTTNQFDALTDFAFSTGLGALDHGLLSELNAGRYKQVPGEFLKWAHRSGGRITMTGPRARPTSGLLLRRRSEGALWNKP